MNLDEQIRLLYTRLIDFIFLLLNITRRKRVRENVDIIDVFLRLVGYIHTYEKESFKYESFLLI